MIIPQFDNLIPRHTFKAPFPLILVHIVLLDILAWGRSVESITTSVLPFQRHIEDEGGDAAHCGEGDGCSVAWGEPGVSVRIGVCWVGVIWFSGVLWKTELDDGEKARRAMWK
jgi:hypothetical protein